MRGNLICFTGIDGSGKTTLAQMVAQALSRQGFKAKYIRGSFDSFKLLLGIALIFKGIMSFLGRKIDDSPRGIATKRRLFKNPLFAKLYYYSALLDSFFQIWLNIKIPLLLGRNVSCDRYIYDTMINLSTELNLPESKMHQGLRRLFYLIPQPDFVFFLDLPEELAYERNKPKKDGVSLSDLSRHKELYLSLSKQFDMVVLDSSWDLGELEHQVIEQVNLLPGLRERARHG